MLKLSCFAAFVLLVIIGSGASTRASDDLEEFDRFNGYQGIIIDSILIDNRNIYDTSDPDFDNFLFKLINRFHVKTTRLIINGEILLQVGQPFDSTLASETERNLRRWLYVYDAWVAPQLLDNGHLKVVVSTIDQWSLNVGLEYSVEGNDKRVRIGVTEKNLAGYNLRLSGYYVDDSREGGYFEGSFSDVRFLRQPILISLNYNDNPKSKIRSLLLDHPFYNLAQKWSYRGQISFHQGRQDFYQGDTLIGQSFYNRDYFESEVIYHFGSSYNKKGVSFIYQYKYEPNKGFGLTELSGKAPVDTLYHKLGTEFSYEKYRYYKGVNYDGIDYTEDIMLGRFYSFTYKRAYRSDFESVYYYNLDFLVSLNMMFSDLMLFSQFEVKYWMDGSEQIRRFQQYSLSGYLKPNSSFLFVGRINLTRDEINSGLEYLILGGESGIRGYDTYYKSGQNRLVANFETRLVSPLTFLTARFGAVAFFDAGKIWNNNDVFKLNDFSLSYGLGLRIGFENSTQNIVRIDLVRTDYGTYEISAGTGQYFPLPGAY